MAEALMSAEADAVCGAEYGTRSDERVNRRNGYRVRDRDTRAGTVEPAIPKLRSGSYFPEWLLERCRRAEQALVSVMATSYLPGVSARRVDKPVEQMGIKGISKSQVSEMSKVLDAQVAAVPQPAAGGRPVCVQVGRRPYPEGPRGRPEQPGGATSEQRSTSSIEPGRALQTAPRRSRTSGTPVVRPGRTCGPATTGHCEMNGAVQR